ncbi:unnamed protein product [Arabis nemorensis]|uniref:Uncharacterized protein n=1 Tax=Arabis nemorensis TaxID=586526 RepID=A0A565BP91_9BRAS|nr:unnamed protein product [Arabis nemorensis]
MKVRWRNAVRVSKTEKKDASDEEVTAPIQATQVLRSFAKDPNANVVANLPDGCYSMKEAIEFARNKIEECIFALMSKETTVNYVWKKYKRAPTISISDYYKKCHLFPNYFPNLPFF